MYKHQKRHLKNVKLYQIKNRMVINHFTQYYLVCKVHKRLKVCYVFARFFFCLKESACAIRKTNFISLQKLFQFHKNQGLEFQICLQYLTNLQNFSIVFFEIFCYLLANNCLLSLQPFSGMTALDLLISNSCSLLRTASFFLLSSPSLSAKL